MTNAPSIPSAWQQLRNRVLTCTQAIELLVDDCGIVNLSLLDREVGHRFFREFPDKDKLPPVIPLLLWQNCFYLGAPVKLSRETVQQLSDRTFTDIKTIPIAQKSYNAWYHTKNLNPNLISAVPLVSPITGQVEEEDIGETTQLFLDRAVDQIGRIKTLISGALRNRASDIHLEPTSDDRLRVRYRIDGILRDINYHPPRRNCPPGGGGTESNGGYGHFRKSLSPGWQNRGKIRHPTGKRRQSAIEKVTAGLTTVSEVTRVLHRNALRRPSYCVDRPSEKSESIRKIG
ncbi:MAG TPA: hypothetical protein IGS17_04125 [Oscillatoriales cyanobacterium M59_W2019_021]|nr:hypothetical protein [Oscillatoriales cyanobacterium M4454_W2019_049]HIK50104.1 hypothetical protein [Oscillatoriales cyanobacterium M59_W2019_021]